MLRQHPVECDRGIHVIRARRTNLDTGWRAVRCLGRLLNAHRVLSPERESEPRIDQVGVGCRNEDVVPVSPVLYPIACPRRIEIADDLGLAYLVGNAAISILHTLGYVAVGLFAVAVIALLVWLGLRRRRA